MKHFYIQIIVLCTMFIISIMDMCAVPANPEPITITQPDGSTLTIRLQGDENFHYETTLDGYPIAKNAVGIFTYAQQDAQGNLRSTSIKANNLGNRTDIEKKYVRQLSPITNFSKINQSKQAMYIGKSNVSGLQQRVYPTTGSPKSLVILVNFSDLSFVVPNANTAFTNLLNQNGYSANGGTGSAKDYFRDNSMGVFNPQFDVAGPFTLNKPYSYYGENPSGGHDMHRTEFVIDACTQAAANGVDFSNYDTDNDGLVDNVFIFYAGYSEAEKGPANSIWPHRWTVVPGFNYTGTVASTVFNGKKVASYACGSELRSNTGATMSGIGTFVHEFSHVLGLMDYYDTTTPSHHTLSYWNVMDVGVYLNSGRTPPSYAAFDRLCLGWLQPTEITEYSTYMLDNLNTSNRAYIITQYGNHNLTGSNPSPVEFFTLENRQKTGWDTFLPGNGMLISHIYYNSTTWSNNTLNNDSTAMGYNLIEADSIANRTTLSGDPFPGTKGVKSCNFILRNKTNIDKFITDISETNGTISFTMGANPILLAPVATTAGKVGYTNFEANWENAPSATGYYITIYGKKNEDVTVVEGFDNGVSLNVNWKITASNVSTTNSGNNAPAIQFQKTGEMIQTGIYFIPASSMSFYIKSINEYNGQLLVEAKPDGGVWEGITTIAINGNETGSVKTVPLSLAKNYTCFRFTYTKGSGALVFDDLTLKFTQKTVPIVQHSYTQSTTYPIANLASETTYTYRIQSSKKSTSPVYENISDYSNAMDVSTTTYPLAEGLLVQTDQQGNIFVLLPELMPTLEIYTLTGRKVQNIENISTNPYKVQNLVPYQLYILKISNRKGKAMSRSAIN